MARHGVEVVNGHRLRLRLRVRRVMSAAARARMARHGVEVVNGHRLRLRLRALIVNEVGREIESADRTIDKRRNLFSAPESAVSEYLKALEMDNENLWKRP